MRIPVCVLLLTAFAPSALAQAVVVQLPAGFRVDVAPPQLHVEVAPPAPSPSHVWVQGYWSFAGGRYLWVPGSYVVAPQPGATWVPARWVFRDGAWYFEPGRWAARGVAVTPPPPAYQPPPPPPPAYQPPPAPPTYQPPQAQPPPRRQLSRREAVERAYEITSQHGMEPVGVRDVEWDDGSWKVKLRLAGGGRGKVEIDPWSGAELRFDVDGGCRHNQYWDGERCRHKGKGHGARKHDDDDD